MPLNQYQKTRLRDIRTKEYIYGLKFLSLVTGAGYSAFDAYRKQDFIEVETYFSGACLMNPFSAKKDAEAGFYKVSEIEIVASRDHKITAEAKNTKVEYENIRFRVNSIIDCPDTNEIVIRASRLE